MSYQALFQMQRLQQPVKQTRSPDFMEIAQVLTEKVTQVWT